MENPFFPWQRPPFLWIHGAGLLLPSMLAEPAGRLLLSPLLKRVPQHRCTSSFPVLGKWCFSATGSLHHKWREWGEVVSYSKRYLKDDSKLKVKAWGGGREWGSLPSMGACAWVRDVPTLKETSVCETGEECCTQKRFRFEKEVS